jgi:hypothetical protein
MSLWSRRKPDPLPAMPGRPAEPPPIVYEVLRGSTWPFMDKLFVREKEERSPFRYRGYELVLIEGTVTDLFTRLFQALDLLGVEIVVTPATSKTVVFRKKVEEPAPTQYAPQCESENIDLTG